MATPAAGGRSALRWPGVLLLACLGALLLPIPPTLPRSAFAALP